MARQSRNSIEILIDAIDQSGRGLDSSIRKLDNYEKRIGDVAKRVAVAGAAITGAFGLALRSAIGAGDELLRFSQSTGVAVDQLSRLTYAAKQSGADVGQLKVGLRTLAVTMREAKDGSEEAASVFRELNVPITDNAGNLRQLDGVFLDVAERISKMENRTLAAAMAQKALGRSGNELIPMLNEGRVGIRALADESDRLGNTWSASSAKLADEVDDAFGRVKASLSGVQRTLLEELGPSIIKFADHIAKDLLPGAKDWIRENRALVESLDKLGGALVVGGAVLGGLSTLAGVLKNIASLARGAAAGITALYAASAGGAVAKGGLAAAGLYGMSGAGAGAAALLGPAGLVVGAGAATIGAYANLRPAGDPRSKLPGQNYQIPRPMGQSPWTDLTTAEGRAAFAAAAAADALTAPPPGATGGKPLDRMAMLIEAMNLPSPGLRALRTGGGATAEQDALIAAIIARMGVGGYAQDPGLSADVSGTGMAGAIVSAFDRAREAAKQFEAEGGTTAVVLTEGFNQLGNAIGSTVGNAFVQGKLKLADFGTAFKQVFAQIISQIVAAIVKLALFKGLLSIFGFGDLAKGFGLQEALNLNRGGVIPGFADGTTVTGGVSGRDSVLARLTPGEAVLPKNLVDFVMGRGRPDSAAFRPVVMPVQFFLGTPSELREVERKLARARTAAAGGAYY